MLGSRERVIWAAARSKAEAAMSRVAKPVALVTAAMRAEALARGAAAVRGAAAILEEAAAQGAAAIPDAPATVVTAQMAESADSPLLGEAGAAVKADAAAQRKAAARVKVVPLASIRREACALSTNTAEP